VPLAEHDKDTPAIAAALEVSIHVPLAEHDWQELPYLNPPFCFNSRAPRGARQLYNSPFICVEVSIHVPLAEHDDHVEHLARSGGVSIHVPLAEHDVLECCEVRIENVSIHVPLAEHDISMLQR